MDHESLLGKLAERYRQQGYTVTIRPGVDVLPPFAKDFKVELLAERPDGNVLVSAKENPDDFVHDTTLPRLADVISKQSGWRYDLTVFGHPRQFATHQLPNAKELSVALIQRALIESTHLYNMGFKSQAVLTAWSALESAMRHRVRALGHKKTGYGSPRTLLNELTSSGEISQKELSKLEELFNLRNVIVHGFRVPAIPFDQIWHLHEIVRRLLAEPEPNDAGDENEDE